MIEISHLVYTKTGIVMIAINVFLLVLSFFQIKTVYDWTSLNPFLITIMLSSFILIRSITVEKFNRDYWIDTICSYIIYGLVYYLGIFNWIMRIKADNAYNDYCLKMFYSTFY